MVCIAGEGFRRLQAPANPPPLGGGGAERLSLGVVAPFALATLSGWAATTFLIVLLLRNGLWSPGHVSVVVVLFALCALLTRHVLPGVKAMLSPRELLSLEK